MTFAATDTSAVCTAQPCMHYGEEQRHDRQHQLREHCTVPVVMCSKCQVVPVGRSEEELLGGGWIRVSDQSGISYRCGTCGVA